jgi:hypothetical protein
MPIEQNAQQDVANNETMKNDPNWTSQEKQKYQAAYNAAKKKQDDQKKSD